MSNQSNHRSFWDMLLGRSSAPRAANNNGAIVNCYNFIRQGKSDTYRNVFVEVHPTGGVKTYYAKDGITPSYMPDDYDSWCLEYLNESYVFSSLQEAQSHFTAHRRTDLLNALKTMSADIRNVA
jgi:hypothetical protein